MKIIGCGTANRADDRAGLVVAEQLRQLGFEAEAYDGDPLALLERWSDVDDVIVVDAVRTGALPGTVHVWDRELPRCSGTAVSSHGFDIGKAIELARVLNKLPATLRVYGIEAGCFERTSKISPEVETAIRLVVRQISSES